MMNTRNVRHGGEAEDRHLHLGTGIGAIIYPTSYTPLSLLRRFSLGRRARVVHAACNYCKPIHIVILVLLVELDEKGTTRIFTPNIIFSLHVKLYFIPFACPSSREQAICMHCHNILSRLA
jgi:hypothetical protein